MNAPTASTVAAPGWRHNLAQVWAVFTKELRDALRDHRTLAVVFLSAVCSGPLILLLVSNLAGSNLKRAEAREVMVHGIERAPTLANYLARQTYTIKPAPADHEAQLSTSRLGLPVVVVPEHFERDLQQGLQPVLEVLSAAHNRRADAAVPAIFMLLQGLSQEQAGLRLAMRGVAPSLLQPLRVQERDLADASSGAAHLASMVPYFVLMAVLYGALSAALDTTAGERERGSLEPLLMTPALRINLVLGKWAAVAALAMMIAAMACLSLLPTQALLKSEALASMFRFGLPETGRFMVLLLPLAAALSALIMAIAIRCKSYKEAQASATVLILFVSLVPMLSMFNFEGERPWHLAVPALAQTTLMARVLKGDNVPLADTVLPAASCVLLTALALAYVARSLRRAAVRG